MATSSQAKTLLGGVPADLKSALYRVMEYIFDRNFAFGPIDTDAAQTATQNFVGRYVKVTTSGTANQEVAIAHGLGRQPNICWQVLDPGVVNATFIGDLSITRRADAMRFYVKSASTSASCWMYVEAFILMVGIGCA